MGTARIIWLALPALLVMLLLSLAGNWTDAIRLGALSLPGAWLFWLAARQRRRWLGVAASVWLLVFLADALVRTSVWWLYGADVTSRLVIEALANTTLRESREFLVGQAYLLVPALAGFSVLTGIYLWSWVVWRRDMIVVSTPPRLTFPARVLAGFLALLAVTAYAMNPSRDLHPLPYWAGVHEAVARQQAEWQTSARWHARWDAKAREDLVRLPDFSERKTLMLVLGDSVTSDNLGVCGYPRDTTPALTRRLSQLTVFCDAYAAAPATIPSLGMKLTGEDLHTSAHQHRNLMAYARQAGFRVFWISNHDDRLIAARYGAYADEAFYANTRSGRSSTSLDERVLPAVESALAHPAARKLVIVHLLGAHPNYANRYPARFTRFSAASNDRVEAQLSAADRGPLIRQLRNQYDNALTYHDWILDQLLNRLESSASDRPRRFLYASDHGNEVGHERDFAGHSPTTVAGFRVPVVIWRSDGKGQGVSRTRLLTDDLDHAALHLMGLDCADSRQEASWVEPGYAFEPPARWPLWQQDS